jgi:hypothetical protein
LNWLRKFWQGLWTSPETLLLRAENQRFKETCLVLEDENEALKKDLRAAVNNLLSEAGAAPLPSDEIAKPGKKVTHRRLSWQQRQRLYAHATAPQIPAKETN